MSRMVPAALLVYMVLIGGTSVGELHPLIRFATNLIVLGLLLAWVRGPARSADRLDAAVLIGLLLFLGAGVASQFMRQSFDAGWMAIGFAAAFTVGRRALAVPQARRLMLAAMAALSVVLALITAARWLPSTAAWVMASGGSPPPLDLAYPSAPWGHRHDVALLLVLLAPAWQAFVRQRLARILAVVAWTLTALIVVLDGSRNLWLAVAVASVLAAWSHWGGRRLLTRRGVTIVAGVLLVASAAVSVALLDRLINLRTIGARNELWEGATEAWLAAPITGQGPGSFPWVLQTTDYFSTNAWAPRHPDSALFQLLPEAGLLGAAAVAVLLIAVIPRIRIGEPSGWALTTFLVACLAANPTDFGFLVASAIAWLASSIPVPPVPEMGPTRKAVASPRARRAIATATIGLAALVGLAQVSVLLGEAAFWRAGAAVEAGDMEAANREVSQAVALDPSLALYHRVDGLIDWSRSGPEAAIPALQEAVRVNAADDLAWRTLAAAQWPSGNAESAAGSIETALRLQRSDLANVLLAVRIASARGESVAASALLAEAVQAWPTLTGASTWMSFLTEVGVPSEAVVDAAIDRWRHGMPGPVPMRTQPSWLVAMGERPDLRDEAIEATAEPRPIAEALAYALTCDRQASEEALARADPSKVYNRLYWQLRVALASLSDREDRAAADALRAMVGDSPPAPADLDLLDEATQPGFSIDNWGYRRPTPAIRGLAGSVPRPVSDWATDLANVVPCRS